MSEYDGTLYGGGSTPRYPRRTTQTNIGWDPEVVALVEGIEPMDDVERRIRPVPPPGSGEKRGM
jgi:hypothetical protein